MTHSLTGSCETSLSLPHFHVICDLLLRRMTTWNVFVKYLLIFLHKLPCLHQMSGIFFVHLDPQCIWNIHLQLALPKILKNGLWFYIIRSGGKRQNTVLLEKNPHFLNTHDLYCLLHHDFCIFPPSYIFFNSFKHRQQCVVSLY